MAALAGCQSGDLHEQGGAKGNEDVIEALAALPEAELLMSSADGVAQFVRGDLGRIDASHNDVRGGSDASLRAALPPILRAFRLANEDLTLRKVRVDELGGRHYRYDQVFGGLPVVGGDLVVHVDARGTITGINGTARGDISPSLGARAVARGAAHASIEDDARWADLTGRTIRDARTVYLQTQAGTLHKAYEQIALGQRAGEPVIDRVYVDVDTGAILEHHPQIHHARNRNTYSANNGTALPGTLKRTETQAATGDTSCDAAHDNAGHVYDFYKVLFNRDGIDNAGIAMVSTCHYSSNYCNAFWNGTQMAYGDGNASQNCSNLTALDVVGHELTHGVTSYESNLVYNGEPGGLNESLSDIFGGGVESWVNAGKGTTPPIPFSLANNVFLIGDLTLPPFLRSMCDPIADGASKDAWYSGIGSVDVHYSSGPNNLVFCLLAKGGTHPRGATSIMVPAIGMEKVLRLFYKSNVDIMTASTNYAGIRNAMVTAAQQLGYDQATQDAVACAYAAIKVGTAPQSCGGTPPPTSTPLANGVPVTGIADSTAGNFKLFSIAVPAGQSTLTITMSGGTGDADLYVNFGAIPTDTAFQCRPYLSGNNETCTFTPPQAGTYYIGLRVYSAYSGVTLTGSYSVSSGCGSGDPVLVNGVGQSLSGAASSSTYRCLKAVPAGKTLTVSISGGTGDADLYTQFGVRPTTASYLCRPYLAGNAETCTHTTTTATAGDWYVMLRGFSAYSGTTLIGSY
ncbi:MAG TPA: pre-peptidase C-terminal domain-containing protein [Kofleriaceae bacterium]|nr:pre-peptidase C-terminal domain-containing protein [Kofleriaceae bacterium]